MSPADIGINDPLPHSADRRTGTFEDMDSLDA